MHEVKVGDVVQIDPEIETFGACLMTVTEVKAGLYVGYVKIPGSGEAFYRVPTDKAERVGTAPWARKVDQTGSGGGESELDAREVDMMGHALGWPKGYRNWYAADPGGPDDVVWASLVERGLASGPLPGPSTLHYYAVTDAGKAALERSDS